MTIKIFWKRSVVRTDADGRTVEAQFRAQLKQRLAETEPAPGGRQLAVVFSRAGLSFDLAQGGIKQIPLLLPDAALDGASVDKGYNDCCHRARHAHGPVAHKRKILQNSF